MTTTNEEILADDSADRRRRMCRCFLCGKVERCTPQTDFYTTPQTGNYLVCTTCFVFRKQLDGRPMRRT